MTELTKQEKEAVEAFILADFAATEADHHLDKLFRMTYEPLLEAGRIEEAQEYIKQMPECVAKIYARDAIRVARGDFD